jgi:hypothetical protein
VAGERIAKLPALVDAAHSLRKHMVDAIDADVFANVS